MKRIGLLMLPLVIGAAAIMWFRASIQAEIPALAETAPVDSPDDPNEFPTPAVLPEDPEPLIAAPAESDTGTTSVPGIPGRDKTTPPGRPRAGDPSADNPFGVTRSDPASGLSLPDNPLNPNEATVLLTHGFRHAVAKDAAATLKELYPGLSQIEIDAGGKILRVRLPHSQLDAVKKALELLDKPGSGAEQEVKIFILQHADAVPTVALLKELYPESPYSIVPDERTNSLIVRGPKNEAKFIEEIETILMRLDAPGTPRDSSKPGASSNAPTWAKDWPVPRATAGTSGRAGDGRKKAGEVSAFQLQNADANKLASKLRTLFPHDTRHIVPNAATNSISVSSDAANYAEIRNIIAGDDQPTLTGGLATWRQLAEGNGSDQSLETLRRNYRNYNDQAAELAREHQRHSADKNATSPAGDEAAIRRKLAEVVALAFSARQQLQQAELSALSQGLIRVQQQIAARERIRQQIIDRRVNDLLNPQTRWEGENVVPSGSLPPTNALSAPVPQPPPENATSRRGSFRTAVPAANVAANVELSQATEMAARFDELQVRISNTEAVLKRQPQHPSAGTLQAQLESARKELELLQKEHTARKQLLQLELQLLETAVNTAAAEVERIRRLQDKGYVSQLELDRAKQELESARLRQEWAATVYQLFDEIDKPKSPAAGATGSTLPPPTIPPTGAPAATATLLHDFSTVTAETELSQATTLAKRFDILRKQVARTEAAIKEFPPEATDNLQAELASARRDLDLLRKEHAARMELLQLELSHAENEFQSRKADVDRGRQLFERGAIAVTEHEQLQRAFDAAKLRLDRAKTIFMLFRDIDASAPEAKPKADGKSDTDEFQEPVGEVKEIDTANARVVFSCLTENDVRPRETLEIRRSDGENYSGPFRLIAKIEVVSVDKKTATARVIELRGRNIGNAIEPEQPQRGDCVDRPRGRAN